MKVLVVEDSPKLQKSLKAGLSRFGYAVDIAEDGEQGLTFALTYEYDVIVLDLMLPKKTGLEVMCEIRKSKRNPEILILSARDQIHDRITGLDLGADDYLVKPFSFDELHARIQALVRRRFNQKSPVLKVGEISIDTSLHIAFNASDNIPLTPTEMSILEYLVLNRGRVMSSDVLHTHIYDSSSYTSKNSIEVHISSLRKKMRDAGVNDVIKTQRGFGYFIE